MAENIKQALDSTPKDFEGLKAQNPGLSENQLKAKASLLLDQELIQLFKKNRKALAERDRLESELAKNQEVVDRHEEAVAAAISSWFDEDGEIAGLYGTDIYLDGLRAIAEREVAPEPTPTKTKASTKGKRTRTVLDDQAKLERLDAAQTGTGQIKELLSKFKGNEVEVSPEDWALHKKLLKDFNAQSIDILSKRLKLKTGDLLAYNSTTVPTPVDIDEDHKVVKLRNTTSSYLVNVAAAKNRLKSS